MYTIKWTQMQATILRVLCIKAGTSVSLRGIARMIKKTPTAVSNALSTLKKVGMIKAEKSKNMNLLSIELNRDDPQALAFKRVENLRMIYESGIVGYLKEHFQGSTMILFGSYSKGEDTVQSDIDIAIIGAKEKNLDLRVFDKLFERKVSINFYKSFKDIHKHLLDNILNGILLNGGVDI